MNVVSEKEIDKVWNENHLSGLSELPDRRNLSCQCEVWEKLDTCGCLGMRTKGLIFSQLAKMDVGERQVYIIALLKALDYESDVAKLDEEEDLR